MDGTRSAAHGGADADAEVHAVEPERLVWVPPTKKEAAPPGGTGQWRFVAEPVEGEAHLTWSDWKVAEHGDRRDKSTVVAPTRDLSQPDLHHLADLLVRNDQPKEAVSLLDEALRLDQAARRAGPGGRVDQIIWTGREITSMAEKLEDSLDRLAKTPPAELTRVHPDVRAVTDDTERLATALNGYITGAAEVSGVYQLRNRYALLVMMGKRVSGWAEGTPTVFSAGSAPPPLTRPPHSSNSSSNSAAETPTPRCPQEPSGKRSSRPAATLGSLNSLRRGQISSRVCPSGT